jgi:hypothetical protein
MFDEVVSLGIWFGSIRDLPRPLIPSIDEKTHHLHLLRSGYGKGCRAARFLEDWRGPPIRL